MTKQGWGTNYEKLEQYFLQKLVNVTEQVTQGKMQYLVWQEVIDNNVVVPKETVVHVWKDGFHFAKEMERVRKKKNITIISYFGNI